MLVIAVGERSQYGILFKNLEVETEPTPLEDKLDNLANCKKATSPRYINLQLSLSLLLTASILNAVGIGWGGMAAAILIFGVLLLFFVVDQFTDTDSKPHCFVLDTPQTVCWCGLFPPPSLPPS